MLNATGAGGVPVVDHVYVKLDSPPSSAPNTDNPVVFPVTGLGVAFAAVAIVGALLVTVKLAVPDLSPVAAVTVKGPPAAAPAVKSPAELTLPPPDTVQVNAGCDTSAAP